MAIKRRNIPPGGKRQLAKHLEMIFQNFVTIQPTQKTIGYHLAKRKYSPEFKIVSQMPQKIYFAPSLRTPNF